MTPLSCDHCEDLLPGYVLAALTPEEAVAVAEHLSTCNRCQAAQVAYEMALEPLAAAVEQHAPPAALRQRLLVAIDTGLTPQEAMSAAVPRARTGSWGTRWVAAWVGVSAVLLLALGGGAWYAWNVITQMRANEQALVQQLDMQRQALAFLAASDSQQAVLSAEGHPSRGVLLSRSTTSDAVLIVLDLPPLQPQRAYQLWLVRDGGRDNGGVFQVDARGYGMLRIQAPQPLASYRAVGITEEPAGGSPGPTSARVIGGKL